MYNRTIVRRYKCTTVQLYNRTTLQLYSCGNVQLYDCTTLQLCKCKTVQMYKCTTVQLYTLHRTCLKILMFSFNRICFPGILARLEIWNFANKAIWWLRVQILKRRPAEATSRAPFSLNFPFEKNKLILSRLFLEKEFVFQEFIYEMLRQATDFEGTGNTGRLAGFCHHNMARIQVSDRRTPSRYGMCWIYWINSSGQPRVGGPPASWFGEMLTTPHCEHIRC